MGVINFGWLVGWLSGFRVQTGSAAYWCYATFVRRLGEAAAPELVVCGPCPEFVSNTLAFVLHLSKITEDLSQGNRLALGCSGPNAIHLVHLAITGDGLDWPAATSRPWFSRQATGSTLSHLKYLQGCRNFGFSTSVKFEKALGQGSDVARNALILLYLPVT